MNKLQSVFALRATFLATATMAALLLLAHPGSAAALSAPSALTLSRSAGTGTSTNVALNWTDNSPGEACFAIERNIGSGFVQIATTTLGATTTTDSNLGANTYAYRVKAYYCAGDTAYSNTATATTPIIPTPISYWKLDESSGNAVDSVGSNTLTNKNGVSYTGGVINNAASFSSSSSQYLSVTDASSTGLDLNGTDFTVSGWVKYASFPSSPPWDPLFSKFSCCGDLHTEGIDTVIGFDSGTYLFILMRNSSEIPTSQIINWSPGPSLNTWYYLTLVYSNSTGVLKFYVDGTEMGEASGFAGIQDTPSDFDLGALRVSGGAGPIYHNGLFDEFGVWNSSLSDSQIDSLYSSGAGRHLDTF